MKLYKSIQNIVEEVDFKNIDEKFTGIKYEL